MKKFCLCFFVLLIVGCGRTKNEVSTDTFSCVTDDSSFEIVVSDGKIVKYVDSVDGELKQESIDIINGEYLIEVEDNNETLTIMDNVMRELGGYCEKK